MEFKSNDETGMYEARHGLSPDEGKAKSRPTIQRMRIQDIARMIADAEFIKADPLQPTPTRLRIGLALIQFGFRLLRKII